MLLASALFFLFLYLFLTPAQLMQGFHILGKNKWARLCYTTQLLLWSLQPALFHVLFGDLHGEGKASALSAWKKTPESQRKSLSCPHSANWLSCQRTHKWQHGGKTKRIVFRVGMVSGRSAAVLISYEAHTHLCTYHLSYEKQLSALLWQPCDFYHLLGKWSMPTSWGLSFLVWNRATAGLFSGFN